MGVRHHGRRLMKLASMFATSMTSRWLPRLTGAASLTALVVVVQLAVDRGVVSSFLVPAPTEVLASFAMLFSEERLMQRFAVTCIETLSAAFLAACGGKIVPPHLRPLSKDTMMLLGKKDMRADTQIFVRIFKEESELEIWKARDDGRFYHFKTYPICTWSGELGPKIRQGDKQAPEASTRSPSAR